MDRAEFENDQVTLKRIAATLLGLAVLAERVSVLPHAIRFLVLWLLRPAEAVAREFVAEEIGGPLALPTAVIFGTDRDSRAGARRLAFCFRALALMLNDLQAHAQGDRRISVPGGSIGRLANLAPKTMPWDGAMMVWRAMALCGAVERIDTS